MHLTWQLYFIFHRCIWQEKDNNISLQIQSKGTNVMTFIKSFKPGIIIFSNLFIDYTSVTFATAAVRSYISTVSRNSTAAAVFLRLHTLAVTFATAAVRRIFNLWRQKNCGCPTSFEVMTAAVVFMTNIKAYARRPQGDRMAATVRSDWRYWLTDWRRASVHPTYGRRRGVYGEHRNEKSYNSAL